jgi:hypothetical protein
MLSAIKKSHITRKTLSLAFALLVVLYGVPSLIYNLTNTKLAKDAKAANVAMQTGYYVGNGRNQAITGLGFSPEFVIIKSDTANTAAVFKTTAMPTTNMAYFSATVDNRDIRLTLDADGFTVSESDQFKLDNDGFTLRNSANINIANVRYTWVAFTGSDCESATSTFCVGTYTGNAAATQNITTGFQPDFVMVKRDTAVGAHYKTTALGSNTETLWLSATVKSASGYINSLNATGFTVGTTDNAGGGTFYYVAFKESANFFKQGSYTGNTTDNTVISGVGFAPDFVIVKNGTNATAASTAPVMNQIESYGNSSSYIGAATANIVNYIKGLETDGFKLGTAVQINTASNTYYYLAFNGASVSSSGTFKMAQGTYTGNGSVQTIENIGFAPDLVIIKNNAAQIMVFRTKLMALDSTAYATGATANYYGGILSLNEDSFDVGASLNTNASGNTYQWQAFGNAYDPLDNAGASDFAIGATYGSGIDDRNISNLPFAPDFVVMKSITNTGSAVIKTSSHSGDFTSYFEATADAANLIQTLRPDGFQVGTGVNVNTSAITYFWFAFKTGDNFKVGSYTGTTLAHSETIASGFQSNLIWTKPATAVGGITKPSTLSGTASQYFLATANATTQITGITEDGFSVGIGTGANAAATIRYMAWRIPYYAPPTNLPGDPGTPTFSGTTTTGTIVSWAAASGADYYIVERAMDRSGTPGLYKYVATTSGLSIADNMLNANQQYWYRVKASNPNGYSGYSGISSVTTNSQTLQIQTGSYVGTGNQFSISGLGFAPEMVIIKSDTANIPTIFKTSAMRDNVLGYFSATADGAVVSLNLENVTYTWTAFAGSDCSSTGYFCLGVYTGTGAAQNITTGFQPDYVSVKNNEAVLANYKTTALGANNHSIFYINTVKNTTGAYISALSSTGFTVGTTNSVAGGTFFYFAFKEKANFFKQGSYTGNSTDNTVISGVGFKPNLVITKNGTNATANNTYGFMNLTQSYGNNSSYFSATANLVNMIKSLETDGFKLGTSVLVNATGDTYYYTAFGGATAPSGSGTFRMAQGSYTGNGTKQTINNIGFKPDLVLIKGNSTGLQVFRTSLMGGNTSAYLGATTANFADAIISLNDGSFDIGGSAAVNTNTVIYQWQAFGNAYDPVDNRGASDFAIGAYYGSGIDDRDIVLPFTPDLVVVKKYGTSTNSAGMLRTSVHPDDSSSYFLGTADAANFIQRFGTNSFQVGTDIAVNASATINFWFAFKAGDNFKVGSYTGTTLAHSETIATGYESDLIWVKAATAVGGVHKPATLAGTASQYFLGTANATTQITGITADGFSVGTGTGANAAATIRYMAWKIPLYVISISVSDGEVSFGTIEAFGSKTTYSTDMPPVGDVQTVTNGGPNSVDVNIKGKNSISSCVWTLAGSNGYNQYKLQACNATDSDCSAPPTNYSDLSTSYQRLFSGLGSGSSKGFHLRLVMPTSTSCFDTQDVSVTVQASEV